MVELLLLIDINYQVLQVCYVYKKLFGIGLLCCMKFVIISKTQA